jgi:hypothetical protein
MTREHERHDYHQSCKTVFVVCVCALCFVAVGGRTLLEKLAAFTFRDLIDRAGGEEEKF